VGVEEIAGGRVMVKGGLLLSRMDRCDPREGKRVERGVNTEDSFPSGGWRGASQRLPFLEGRKSSPLTHRKGRGRAIGEATQGLPKKRPPRTGKDFFYEGKKK